MPRQAAVVLAAAACLAVTAAATASPPSASGQAVAPAAPEIQQVAAGPARSLGEPGAARDSEVTAVTATTFGAAGAQAEVWTQLAGSTAWRRAGAILPSGFGSSYDPAAAGAPGGPLLVVAGTAPPRESCIASGSVAVASVDSKGKLGPARLVSDQRGTGSFDDRPAVAVGQHGMAWVAWSHGPDADACQDVGQGDRIEVAVSRDGGQTFGAPIAIPAVGGHSAFGVRLAPLPGGQVAVSWTETMANGDQAVLVSVLGADGRPRQPEVALAGDGPPLVLPGASFYDFPAGDIGVLPSGKLIVAAPRWVSGRSVIGLATGTLGGQWHETSVSPPAGGDLLLPALGVLPTGDVRLLCADHTRAGDRLGYDWAGITVASRDLDVSSTRLTALTPAPPGPGFFEIGEELALSGTQDGLLTAIVVAGRDGATLETATFSAPPAATAKPGQAGTPGPAPATGRPGMAGPAWRTASAASTVRATGERPAGFTAMTTLLAAAVLCCIAAATALLRRRRRSGRNGV